MSLIDVDSWVTEQESIERLHKSILTDIVTRNNYQINSKDYTKLSAHIRIKINQFEREFVALKLKLDSVTTDNTITFDESETRKYFVRQIETDHKKLLEKFRNISNYTAANARTSKSIWQSETDDEPLTSVSIDPRKQTIDIIEEQNRGLEALSETISRQMNLASRLGQEVEEQNEILDDLATNINRFDGRINNTTRNIVVINNKDSTWRYWLVIILLFVIICIVATV